MAFNRTIGVCLERETPCLVATGRDAGLSAEMRDSILYQTFKNGISRVHILEAFGRGLCIKKKVVIVEEHSMS